MKFLNKMERKLGRYAIHGLMKYVIACYIIGYIIQMVAPAIIQYLTLEPYFIFHNGQVWRLVSWILLPPGRSNIIFMIIMLFLYYQLGTALEYTLGTFRFNLYIFMGLIFTILGAMLIYIVYGFMYGFDVFLPGLYIGPYFSMDYINMGIFIAFAICYPDTKVNLYFIIPIKMKWMAILYAVLIAYQVVIGVTSHQIASCVAIVASVLNVLIFFLMTRNYRRISPKEIKRKADFKKHVSRPAGITKHKCAVCGRSEEDGANLEFRFCSKCNGNYEYCQDHLFTHIHVE